MVHMAQHEDDTIPGLAKGVYISPQLLMPRKKKVFIVEGPNQMGVFQIYTL